MQVLFFIKFNAEAFYGPVFGLIILMVKFILLNTHKIINTDFYFIHFKGILFYNYTFLDQEIKTVDNSFNVLILISLSCVIIWWGSIILVVATIFWICLIFMFGFSYIGILGGNKPDKNTRRVIGYVYEK